VVAFLGLGITQTFIGLLSIVYLQKLLDTIPAVRKFFDLGAVFLAYALLCAVNYLLAYLEEYPRRILQYGIYQWAKVVAIKKISRIDYQAYQNLGTGKLVQLIEHGAESTQKILFEFYLRIVQEILPGIVFSLIFIGIYSHEIMLVLLGGYLIVFAISYVLLKYLHEKKEQILSHEEDFSRFSVRGFMELVVFRINKRFTREIERVEGLSDEIVKSKAQVRMIHELFFVLFAYIVFGIRLGVIYFQINQILAGVSTIGTLVALIRFVDMVYQPIAIFNVLYVDYKLDKVTLTLMPIMTTLRMSRRMPRSLTEP
jgi:ATP-binding cassette subfamily B protein